MRNHIHRVRRSKSAQTTVGVRELKTHAARILRHVREARASYILTHRGQAVGVILPLDAPEEVHPSADDANVSAAWDAFLRAGQRIQHRFRAGAGGVRLLSQMRR
jgi:antitoxin (DNA-binding transcriptional repressor) of toxin-antitoxin stability system